MELKVHIKLDPPRWLRHVIVYVALPIGVLLGGALAVRAGVTLTRFAAHKPISSKDVNDNFTALNDAVSTLQDGVVPPGSISAFGGATPPPGWLSCDGSSVSRKTYPGLFAAIGTGWGAVDTSHFNLPDLRGRFLRGADSGSGRDPDRASRTASAPGGATGDGVGTLEADAFEEHDHGGKTDYANRQNGAFTTPLEYSGSGAPGIAYAAVSELGVSGPLYQHTHAISAEGGAETRPVNGTVSWIIKTD